MAQFSDLVQRGLRSAQPVATAVAVGTIYHVSDESVTERSTGAAWEDISDGGSVADDAVTNAKLANMAQSTIKGRAAGAGTGDPADLSAAQVNTILATVVGPGSATDNALARFDGTTGKLVQDTSVVTLSDVGAFTFPDNVRQTFNPGANAAGLNVGSIAGDPDTPTNGDLWYDSTANELTGRINGANVALGAGTTSDSFKTIAVSGQSDVVADSSTDTLTLVAGSNVTITTNAGADSITIAASGGGGGGGLTLVEQHTASNSATLDFTTGITSTYDDYLIRFINIVPANNTALQIQLSTDGGSSWDTSLLYDFGASYAYPSAEGAMTGTAPTTIFQIRDTNTTLTANGSHNGWLDFFAPLGARLKTLGGTFYLDDGTVGILRLDWFGRYHNTTAVDAFRIKCASGNITSGTVRLYGREK